jgi:hypothetical protein
MRIFMNTKADHVEQALDDALSMTFPASDPVAVFMRGAPAEKRIERNPPVVARPRKAGRKVSASRDETGHF